MKLLSPRLDVVFKMLFADRNNRRLLESLLTAVLQPPSPIVNVTVIDPEIPKDLTTEKGVRLDVLVELENGTLIDVEMECDARRAGGERWLYHWARLFVSTLRRGESYEEVDPVACIVFLDARTATRSRFHSIYEAREVHDHSRLSPTLAIHVIELPRIAQAREEHENPELQRWARFLRVEDEAALESLAGESPIMAEAKHALETLSREPSAQKIAELRRDAEIFRRLERAQDLREGRAEGRAEGLAEAVLALCQVVDVEVGPDERAQLDTWSPEQRGEALRWLATHRSWPHDV